MNIDEVLATFVTESRELLQEMENALLACERSGADAESINSIFRAAHTIKGSAGMFALDHIVRFTHVLETCLDLVRGGRVALSAPLITLLLECCDHIIAQIDGCAAGETTDTPESVQRAAGLIDRLQCLSGIAPPVVAAKAATVVTPATAPAAQGEDRAVSDAWHISVRFSSDVLRNGMDPVAFIRYLATFGELVAVEVVTHGVPPVADFDPEVCYLGFEVALRTTASKERIEAAFDFVRDDCQLSILPPNSLIADFEALLRERREPHEKLGDILVACGSLTARELGIALRMQAEWRSAGATSVALGEILVQNGVVQGPVVAAALESQEKSRALAKQLDSSTIRVETSKLDRLIDLIGELIVVGAGTQLGARRAQLADLTELASRLARLVEEVRDSALELRMVQIGGTFNRFQRVVREVSAQLGKQVALEISGAETEIDKTMVERLNDPLLHLVRNAIDHGIELPEVRTAAGKPPQGSLSLRARHESGSIIIEIGDDGRGIDRDRVRRKAIERGLITADASLRDAEILELLFAPGFSTAEAVTDLSGRGVGMDVVKRNIEQLRGTVELASEPGKGSTVRMRLPLTLAIIDAFLMRVGPACYVVPLDVVDECVELPATDVAEGADYLGLRGSVLPMMRLRERFSIGGPVPRRQNVVVIRWGARRVGLVVDALLGKLQAVIKPLPEVLSPLDGITGSTILGDGSVALILDIGALAVQAELQARAAPSNLQEYSR